MYLSGFAVRNCSTAITDYIIHGVYSCVLLSMYKCILCLMFMYGTIYVWMPEGHYPNEIRQIGIQLMTNRIIH